MLGIVQSVVVAMDKPRLIHSRADVLLGVSKRLLHSHVFWRGMFVRPVNMGHMLAYNNG